MTDAEIAARAALCWLLFPAIAVPVGLEARRRGHPSILRRFVPWLAIIPAALVTAYLGPGAFALLIGGCTLGSALELASLSRRNAATGLLDASAIMLAATAFLPAAWWSVSGHPVSQTISVFVVLGSMAAVSVAPRHARWPLPFVALAVGVMLTAWVCLELAPYGFRFVLVAFSAIAIADVMAFAIGGLVGGPRPFPRLSPGKTLSGYAAGVVSAILVTYLLYFALPEFSWSRLTEFGFVLGLSGAAGDLGASVVKRRHGVKDFGTLLGPQGGLLDRLDSLLAGGWIAFIYLAQNPR